MENRLYCVRYRNINKPYYGYIRPWNAVRDKETYSLTYLIPSFIDGVKQELGISGKIVRHKLKYDIISFSNGDFSKAVTYGVKPAVHKRYCLKNPEVIFAFDKKEDAEFASTQPLWMGQIQYPIYPDVSFGKNGIKVMSSEEFDELSGVETFISDEIQGIYVGNNRQKNNERMFIDIVRKLWINEN